jgi:transposase
MAGRWELTDKQWELVEPILRPRRRQDNRGRPRHDTRAVLDGVLWILGNGAQWAEMPAKYPPYQTMHNITGWLALRVALWTVHRISDDGVRARALELARGGLLHS